ncbi:unnamed protein product [Ectocarpus sp. 12 AP-2014]
MKKIILLLFFNTLISCTIDDTNIPAITACGTENPIEDLPWLKTLVNELKEEQSEVAEFFFIEIAEYKGETIFISNNCCPICSTVIPIYDCNGDFLGFLNDEIKTNELRSTQTIFNREDFPCQ